MVELEPFAPLYIVSPFHLGLLVCSLEALVLYFVLFLAVSLRRTRLSCSTCQAVWWRGKGRLEVSGSVKGGLDVRISVDIAPPKANRAQRFTVYIRVQLIWDV